MEQRTAAGRLNKKSRPSCCERKREKNMQLKVFSVAAIGGDAQRLCLYGKLLDKEVWTEKQYYEHIVPLLAFTSHAYAKRWRRRVVESRRAPTA